MESTKSGNFTGFPSPAEEYREAELNLQSLLVRSPLSTFFVRFEGDAMTGEKIFDQDLLVVERGSEFADGQIVMAFVDGQRLVRKLRCCEDGLWLCPANERYADIAITEEVQIFGRVIHSITHHLRKFRDIRERPVC